MDTIKKQGIIKKGMNAIVEKEEVGECRELPSAEGQGKRMYLDTDVCKQCGKQIIQVAKRKKKIFCCDACRQNWWSSHQLLVNRSSKCIHHFTCPSCGKPFTAYGNSKRKFCSHHCYIRSRYY